MTPAGGITAVHDIVWRSLLECLAQYWLNRFQDQDNLLLLFHKQCEDLAIPLQVIARILGRNIAACQILKTMPLHQGFAPMTLAVNLTESVN